MVKLELGPNAKALANALVNLRTVQSSGVKFAHVYPRLPMPLASPDIVPPRPEPPLLARLDRLDRHWES